MALELNIFLLILGAAAVLYLSGVVFKVPHLFLFGCVLLFGSGAILWGANGLVTSQYYDVDGVLAQNVLDMTNVGLTMFAFILVGIPIVSYLVMDFNPKQTRQVSPWHY
jgi:hypothetical protein